MKRKNNTNHEPEPGASSPPVTELPQLSDSDLATPWPGYCKFATKLHRSDELTQFLDELNGGQCSDVKHPSLFAAAGSLVFAAANAGVRLTNWLPVPSEQELASPTWVADRLAAERANQEAGARHNRWKQDLAHALGEPRPTGTGTIRPVHLQQSRHSRDELGCRLQRALDRPGFKREWLDHRSPHYIRDRDGGISNKNVVALANLITGNHDQRSFDNNWAIVTNWLREQPSEQSSEQPPSEAAPA